MRQTKIICTMGPSVDSDEKIRELILAGMDAARFNFSHGSYDEHKARMDRVKRISKELKQQIPLILDTKGPEIRVRDFENGSVILEEGQTFTLYASADVVGNKDGVSVTFPYMSEDVKAGDEILIDDGLVSSPDYDPAFPPEHVLSAPQLLFSRALYHISHIYFFM